MSLDFGDVMRRWREIRRFSQLSLATESGISSRHISFLETGRSKPSRGCVLTLARVLDMPKPAVNEALLTAGFAPEYPALNTGAIDLAPMMSAITTILDNHAPYPAIVIDAGWQIVGGNAPAMRLVEALPFRGSLCVVDALLNDDPEAPIFLNWQVIAVWTLVRLQMEAAKLGSPSPLSGLCKRLADDPRMTTADLTTLSNQGAYLTMQARIGGHELSLFTMLAEFTTAQDITMSERRVELFFPADDQTRAFFASLNSSK